MIDIFVSKWASNGSYLWTQTLGSAGGEELSTDLAIDSVGNIWITGYFKNTLDFKPKAETDFHSSYGTRDVFVSQWTGDGDYRWTTSFGGVWGDHGSSIAIAPNGNGIVCGNFQSSVNFGGVDGYSSNGSSDIFVSALDKTGQFLWTRAIGGSGAEGSQSATVDIKGNVLLSGKFWGLVDFNPNAGTDLRQAVGYWDAFVTKLIVFSTP